MSEARVIKLVVEYDGTGLSGWQRQDNGPSVQEHLERAVAGMVGAPTTVYGASRTDAGVHAEGQVASFSTTTDIPIDGFRMGLNSALPEQIAVVQVSEAAADFHARFSARGKRYRYSLFTRPSRSPFWHRRAWHRPGRPPLDLDAMRRAAEHFIGEHDFAAFRATGCQAQTTRRRIHQIDIEEPLPHRVDVWVRGNAFLRNMVRIIAGTLVEVGQGRLQADEIASIIASGDRTRAGQTAPAHGLTLVEVLYPPS